MDIYVMTKDGIYVAAFKFKAGIAAYLGIKISAVRMQFLRKGYYRKGTVYVYRDVLR